MWLVIIHRDLIDLLSPSRRYSTYLTFRLSTESSGKCPLLPTPLYHHAADPLHVLLMFFVSSNPFLFSRTLYMAVQDFTETSAILAYTVEGGKKPPLLHVPSPDTVMSATVWFSGMKVLGVFDSLAWSCFFCLSCWIQHGCHMTILWERIQSWNPAMFVVPQNCCSG